MMFFRLARLPALGVLLLCWGCGDDSGGASRDSLASNSGVELPSSPAAQARPVDESDVNVADAPPSLEHGRIRNAKVHQVVKSPFRFGTATVEVLGVCSYEEGIRCTDLAGKPAKDCERKLSEFLDLRKKTYGDSAVPYRIGLNNRALIFRVHHSLGTHEPSWITFAGPPNNGSHAESLKRVGRLDKVRDAEAVVFFGVPQSSKMGSLAALLHQPLRASPGFKLAPSEAVEIERHQLKVLTVEKEGDQWVVRFELSKTYPSQLALSVRFRDANGRLIEQVDRSGKPITQEEKKRLLEQYAQHPTAEAERPVRLADEIPLTKESENIFKAKIPVDPQYVAEATLFGKMWILYDIGNIRLGPGP